MNAITLTTARLRKSPGYVGKGADDILANVPDDQILALTGNESQADGLQWKEVITQGLTGWVAQWGPNGAIILETIADNETDFDKALRFVLKFEGGYVNDPRDPGGETNFGISKRAYPDLDIASLTRQAAGQIYFKDYWQASGADKLAWPLNVIHFDTSVNCGIARANNFLAGCAGNPGTYLDMRLGFYKLLSTFQFFGSGWAPRRRATRFGWALESF